MSLYWDTLSSFTTFIFSSFGLMLDFLISNPLTFTALAIGLIIFAFDILFGVGKDNDLED